MCFSEQTATLGSQLNQLMNGVLETWAEYDVWSQCQESWIMKVIQMKSIHSAVFANSERVSFELSNVLFVFT
jgi:hypothetical protein